MRKFLIAAAVLAVASSAQAGPFGLFGGRGGRCRPTAASPCQAATPTQYATPSACQAQPFALGRTAGGVVVQATGQFIQTVGVGVQSVGVSVCGGCANGVCRR